MGGTTHDREKMGARWVSSVQNRRGVCPAAHVEALQTGNADTATRWPVAAALSFDPSTRVSCSADAQLIVWCYIWFAAALPEHVRPAVFRKRCRCCQRPGPGAAAAIASGSRVEGAEMPLWLSVAPTVLCMCASVCRGVTVCRVKMPSRWSVKAVQRRMRSASMPVHNTHDFAPLLEKLNFWYGRRGCASEPYRRPAAWICPCIPRHGRQDFLHWTEVASCDFTPLLNRTYN